MPKIPIPFDGGLVVLDEELQRLFALNPGAGAIWTLLNDGFAPDFAAEMLAEVFGVRRQQAHADIDSMRAEWCGTGLLESPAVSNRSDVCASFDVRSQIGENYFIFGRIIRIEGFEIDTLRQVSSVFRMFRSQHLTPSDCLRVCRTEDAKCLVLILNGCEQLRVQSPAEMIGAIFQTVLELLRPGVTWLALIHGASVALDGRGVLLSAISGSGKSTLSAYLAARGFEFLSDDLIALEAPKGYAVPWPMPHSLKRGSWKLLSKYYPDLDKIQIDQIGDREIKFVPPIKKNWPRTATPIHMLLFPKYKSRVEPQIKRLTALEAFGNLISDRIWLGKSLNSDRVSLFLDWLTKVPCFELLYDKLEDAEILIRDRLERFESVQDLLPHCVS